MTSLKPDTPYKGTDHQHLTEMMPVNFRANFGFLLIMPFYLVGSYLKVVLQSGLP